MRCITDLQILTKIILIPIVQQERVIVSGVALAPVKHSASVVESSSSLFGLRAEESRLVSKRCNLALDCLLLPRSRQGLAPEDWQPVVGGA